jgi:two-component system, OmpR family, sensor histidine kinase BaeS
MTLPLVPAAREELPRLWLASLAVAALGATIVFLAAPGVNWGIWTLAASAAFLYFVRRSGRALDPTLLMLVVLACVLAFGAGITASPTLLAMSFLCVVTLLATAMLIAAGRPITEVGPGTIPFLPPLAAGYAMAESGRRVREGVGVVRSERSAPVLRGAMIALPMLAVCALLLSDADPLFAAWRDGTVGLMTEWSFIPRVLCFVVLGTFVLGAYGIAVRDSASSPAKPARASGGWWRGGTEQMIVVASVSALLALFLVLQLSYALGNAPAARGSGITYAEYAHRGFAELTIVASLCTVVIALLDRERVRIRMVSLFLIIELQLLLALAYRRLALYESAYGYTTTRLYGEVYMVIASLMLVMLARELWTTVDVRRLARRGAMAGALAVAALTYWNHEAWIAHENIQRFRATGRIDLAYLGAGLSLDAAPVIVRLLPSLSTSCAGALRRDLALHYSEAESDHAWYEWNLRRSRGLAALRAAGVTLTPPLPGDTAACEIAAEPATH